MTMATEHSSPPQRWRIGPGLIALIGVGGLLLLLILVIAGALFANHRRLNAELERIRAAGEPVSVEEIEAFYQAPPAGQDTTQLWLAALAPLDTPQFQSDAQGLPFVAGGPDSPDSIPWPGEPWPQLEAAEQFLSRYGRSLDEMHRAARQGGRARFPTRFADGIEMPLPHLQQLRAGTRLLALESAVHAHRKRPEAAVESIAAMFAAARSLEQEPLTVSQLVRMALGGVARRRLTWLLSALRLDEDQLAQMDAELSDCDYDGPLHRACLVQRAIGIQTFADPTALGPEAPASRLGLMRLGDEVVYLQAMDEIIAAMRKSGIDRKAAVEQADLRLKQVARAPLSRLQCPLTLLLVGAFDWVPDAASRHEAECKATLLAVAIERYQRGEGRLPQNLDEIVPKYLAALPIDPFSRASLRYRVDPAEYFVYSVGSNGVDDGGVSEPPNQPADIVVRVRRCPWEPAE